MASCLSGRKATSSTVLWLLLNSILFTINIQVLRDCHGGKWPASDVPIWCRWMFAGKFAFPLYRAESEYIVFEEFIGKTWLLLNTEISLKHPFSASSLKGLFCFYYKPTAVSTAFLLCFPKITIPLKQVPFFVLPSYDVLKNHFFLWTFYYYFLFYIMLCDHTDIPKHFMRKRRRSTSEKKTSCPWSLAKYYPF